jgi:hypothetical protein
VVAALTVCEAASGAPLGREPLALHGPAQLVLGEQASVPLRLSGEVPADLELYASVGRVSGPVRTPQGEWLASYSPPATEFPQVAIVVAASRDRQQIAWLAVPMSARPSVQLRSEARAELLVTVDGRAFGPVVADRKGRADLRIVVPPGVARATIHSRDAAGNASARSLELAPQAFSRLLALCPNELDDRLWLFAVEDSATPLQRAAFELRTSAGTLSPAAQRAPGVFISRLQAGSEVESEEAEISASLTGAPPAARCRAIIPHEAPSRLSITAAQPVFEAGRSGGVALTIGFAYREGRRPRRVVPQVTVDVGTLGPLEELGRGRYRTRWTLPSSFAGARRATASATAPAIGLLSRTQIRLEPGAPARIEVEPRQVIMRADGRSRQRLTARVYDRHGNPVERVSLRARSEPGGTLRFVPAGAGRFVASYIAPRHHESRLQQLEVTTATGAARARVPIRLTGVRPRHALAVRAGVLTNLGRLWGPQIAAQLSLRLPLLDEQLVTAIEVGFHGGAAAAWREDQVERVNLAVLATPVLARLAYVLPRGEFDAHAGIAAGVLVATSRISSARTGTSQERTTSRAAAAYLGVSHPWGPGRWVAEGGYLHAPVSGQLSGNAGGVHGSVGYAVLW